MQVLQPVAREADGLGFGCGQIRGGAEGDRLQGEDEGSFHVCSSVDDVIEHVRFAAMSEALAFAGALRFIIVDWKTRSGQQ